MSETCAPVGVIEHIDVKLIVIDEEHNPRCSFDKQKLLSLGKSMQENTQLQPIIVNKVSDGVYELVAGERRLRAATDAGQETIEAKVFEGLTKLQVTRMAMAENRDRVNLNVLEEAYGYNQLLDLGVSIEEIASSERCSIDKIRKRLDLLELEGDVQDLITREKNPLPIHQALVIKKLPKSDQVEVAKKAAPVSGPVASEAAVREMVDDILGPPLPGMKDKVYDEEKEPPEAAGGDDSKKEIAPDKLNPEPPEPVEKKVAKKVAEAILKLKPIDVTVGIKGRMGIDADGNAYFRKSTVTVNSKGKIEILSADTLTVGLEGDNLVKVVKLIKKAQPAASKKKTVKKKTARK